MSTELVQIEATYFKTGEVPFRNDGDEVNYEWWDMGGAVVWWAANGEAIEDCASPEAPYPLLCDVVLLEFTPIRIGSAANFGVPMGALESFIEEDSAYSVFADYLDEIMPLVTALRADNDKEVSLLTAWNYHAWTDYEGAWECDYSLLGVVETDPALAILSLQQLQAAQQKQKPDDQDLVWLDEEA
jgi:hypothetical protein